MFHANLSNLLIQLNRSKIRLMLYFCLLFAGNSLKAQQEPMYSEYMFNMSHINPAYAGNRATDNITALYRKQWVAIDGAPATASLSWDKRAEGNNVGYGLQIYNDQLGIENTSGIQAFYSFRISFEKSFLSFGLSGGVLNYRAAFSRVITTQSDDPVFQNDVNGFLPTAGFGMLYATDNWYMGLSVPALFETKININESLVDYRANNHFFLTGGYIFKASEMLKLKPSMLLKAVKGAPLEYDFNMNAWIQDILGLGVSYRTNDALVTMFDIQVSDKFRLGYAYDYTISNLKPFSKGTHELMLRYEFTRRKNQRILSPRYY